MHIALEDDSPFVAASSGIDPIDPHRLVLIHDPQRQQWVCFQQPERIVVAHRWDEVMVGLEAIAAHTEAGGYAAGFLSYEAAPAFDPAFRVDGSVRAELSSTQAGGEFPLLWFGLYARPVVVREAEVQSWGTQGAGYQLSPWRANRTEAEFRAAIAQIKAAIAQGQTYQVNYTFRLRAEFRGSPWALFRDLMQAQPGNYAAFLDLGDWAIASASPELFFSQEGDKLTTRPMKGTIARGQTPEADQLQAQRLYHSPKDQAENLMIVDMLRNDLGRIAQIGSVEVPHLFSLEPYPTLWQMTSTVTAQSPARLPELMRSLFPCASITGAPKASTMAMIQTLEASPRRIYTGAIGMVGPGQTAQFNVAIRTVLIDRHRAQAEYGVGSGIVWDSDAGAEYAECQLKTAILRGLGQNVNLEGKP